MAGSAFKKKSVDKNTDDLYRQYFEAHFEGLFTYAYTIVKDSAEARDIAQSSFIKLWQKRKEIEIRKGQTGLYRQTDQVLAIREGIDVNSLSYATKSFSFNDLSLPEVCAYLENSFQVSIRADKEKLGNCRITAQFDNKPLDYILDVISATLNTSYTKQGSNIFIHGEGCQ